MRCDVMSSLQLYLLLLGEATDGETRPVGRGTATHNREVTDGDTRAVRRGTATREATDGDTRAVRRETATRNNAEIAVTVDGTLKVFQSILIDLIADFLLALVVHRDSWQIYDAIVIHPCEPGVTEWINVYNLKRDRPVPDLCWTGQGHHSLVYLDLCILMGLMDIYRASCSDEPVPDLCWTGQGHHSLVYQDLCILKSFIDIYSKVQVLTT
uniref:Uncharacterized protein n=1 Tax=Amphimedon queenslandica TaxID=400682 RepID=A0A1X7T205_AMPQE